MKKIFLIMLISLVYCSFFTNNIYAMTPVEITNNSKEQLDEGLNPRGAVVTTTNGQILYKYHKDKKVDPASTTKLMTMLVIYEDINHSKMSLKDKVKISERYEKMSQLPNLTTFPLKKGQTYTIEQLLKQAALNSSNAATLVLAEHIDGDISKFTDRMNREAHLLGMNQTHFTNPSGADNKIIKPYEPKKYKDETRSYTTANDMAILTNHLLRKYPNILKMTQLETDTQYHQQLHNTNLSLPHQSLGMKNVDGLKTGTSKEGYNLALTAKKDQLRVNTNLFNIQPYPSEKAKFARHKVANALTQNVFKNYTYRKVISKGVHQIDGKTYNVKEDLYDVVPKDKSKYELKISGKNYLSVKYNRQFTKGEHIPSVKVKPKFNFLSVSFQIILAIAGIILVSVIVIIAVKLYIKNYNKN